MPNRSIKLSGASEEIKRNYCKALCFQYLEQVSEKNYCEDCGSLLLGERNRLLRIKQVSLQCQYQDQ